MYSTVCSKCGYKSESAEEYCPNCGARKQEILSKTSFYNSVVESIASKIDFLDNSIIITQLFLRSIFLLAGIIFIPSFIRNSELFWLACVVFTIFGIIKEIENNFVRAKGLYLFSKILISSYIGAAAGSLISYTGKNYNYSISYYFNYKFLMNEVIKGNFLVIMGLFTGIITLGLLTYAFSLFKDTD